MVRESINTGWIVVGIDSGNYNFTCPLRPNSLPVRFGWNIVDIRVVRIMERRPHSPRLLGPTLIIGVTVSPILIEPAAKRRVRCPVFLNARAAAIGARIGCIGVAVDKGHIIAGQIQAEVGVNSADLELVGIRAIPDNIVVVVRTGKTYLDAVFPGDLEGVHACNTARMPYGRSAARGPVVHGVG